MKTWDIFMSDYREAYKLCCDYEHWRSLHPQNQIIYVLLCCVCDLMEREIARHGK